MLSLNCICLSSVQGNERSPAEENMHRVWVCTVQSRKDFKEWSLEYYKQQNCQRCFNVFNWFVQINIPQVKLERRRLHVTLSRQPGLHEQVATTRPLGPRRGSRWGRCHRSSHQLRRGYRRTRWLEVRSLVKEAVRPPPPSTPVGCHSNRRPPGCKSFILNLSN